MKELTDLEICKRIANIENIYYIETKYTDKVNFLGLVAEPDGCGTPPELIGEYNPLKDDALCFQLMIKYEINVETYHKLGNDKKYYLARDQELNEYEACTPNKAICLAIIEANND